MSEWGWRPEKNLGIWRYGAGWLRPVMTVVPYVTICLLLLMMHFVSGTLSSAKGVLFDLPDGTFTDTEGTDLVALVMPVSHDTMVLFDDSRYMLGDEVSMRSFDEDLAVRLERTANKSLLVLADRRISVGSLMELVAQVKRSGVERVLVAGKRNGGSE